VTQRGMKNKVSQVLFARHPSDYGPSVLVSDLEGPRLFWVIRWQSHSPKCFVARKFDPADMRYWLIMTTFRVVLAVTVLIFCVILRNCSGGRPGSIAVRRF
jgi:hypothetical protein